MRENEEVEMSSKKEEKSDGAYVRKRNKSDRSGRRQVLVRV